MNLIELYKATESNYDEAVLRFSTEEKINKFLGMFLKDSSFAELQAAVAAKDWDAAFRAVHTLKGVAGNMSLTRLRSSASELTEAIRDGKVLADYALYDAVCKDYEMVTSKIKAYLGF